MNKLALGTIVCALLLAGCGSTKTTATQTTQPAATTPTASTPTTTTTPTSGPAAGGLQAEATAAATGDIPDNQMFLVYKNPQVGYSIKYPEGWAQSGSGNSVTIRDKNNIVRIEVRPGPLPSFAQAKSELGSATVTSGPTKVTINGQPAIKLTYSTQSAANPVTGKRVTLVVDRYYILHGSKVAVIDLGTPQGVDNVDAYRMMVKSFTWK
jgi:hypothetical protein